MVAAAPATAALTRSPTRARANRADAAHMDAQGFVAPGQRVEQVAVAFENREYAGGSFRFGARKDVTGKNSRILRVDARISPSAACASMWSNRRWVSPWQPTSWPASTIRRTVSGLCAPLPVTKKVAGIASSRSRSSSTGVPCSTPRHRVRYGGQSCSMSIVTQTIIGTSLRCGHSRSARARRFRCGRFRCDPSRSHRAHSRRIRRRHVRTRRSRFLFRPRRAAIAWR